VSLRMFIIDPSFGEEPDGSYVAFINPVLSNHGGADLLIEEGCLSVPDIRSDVIRPETVSVDYTTLDGEQVHVDADELFARVIQHEFDHLDGLMFVDRLTPLRRRSLDSELKAMARSQKKNRLR
jgi:peptide deformylase